MYLVFYIKIKICLQTSETCVFFSDMWIPIISYLVSGAPLFTTSQMNDLRSEFISRNLVDNASRFTALKMGGNVLYCWWKAFIWLKLTESLLQPKSCGLKTYQSKYPRIWLHNTRWQRYFIGQSSLTALAVLWISEKLIFDMGIGFKWWK